MQATHVCVTGEFLDHGCKILRLANLHKHTSKFSNQKPNFTVFMALLKSYLDTLHYSTSPKAVKIKALCIEFDLYLFIHL